MRHTAVPGGARTLHAVTALGARLRVVHLHVEIGVVIQRAAGVGVQPFGPVQIIHILCAFDKFAGGAIERIVKPIAPEVTDNAAALTVDGGVVEHMDAVFVVIPRIIRRVLKVPLGFAGIDIERDYRIGVEVVAGARFCVVNRIRVAGAEDVHFIERII